MNLSKPQGVPAVNRRHAVARLLVVPSALVLAFTLTSYRASFGEPSSALLVGVGRSGSLLPPSPTGATAAAGQQTITFRITGSATKLFPGATVPLVLTVTNPESVAIVVTSLTVKVGNASSTCTASNLSATAFTGKLSVPALGSAKATLHVSMHLSAPNACKGAKFPLAFSGLAGEA
jgi:hypothetical protein